MERSPSAKKNATFELPFSVRKSAFTSSFFGSQTDFVSLWQCTTSNFSLKSSDDFPVVILQPPNENRKKHRKTPSFSTSPLGRARADGKLRRNQRVGSDIIFETHPCRVFFLTRIRITHKASTNPSKTSFDITN